MASIGILGARKYRDKQSVLEFLRRLPADSVVVTSSCKGVCSWARIEAEARGLEIKIFSPDLNNIRAKFEVAQRYYERNRQLIEASDAVYAFVSEEAGFTGGTRFEVEYALKLGKPVELHWENTNPESFSKDWLVFFQETFA